LLASKELGEEEKTRRVFLFKYFRARNVIILLNLVVEH